MTMLSITKLVQELILTKSTQKKKNFQLEHTKPIFNDMNLLSFHHLYIYHTFIDSLKLLNIEFLYHSLNYLKVVYEMSIYVYLYLGLN